MEYFNGNNVIGHDIGHDLERLSTIIPIGFTLTLLN